MRVAHNPEIMISTDGSTSLLFLKQNLTSYLKNMVLDPETKDHLQVLEHLQGEEDNRDKSITPDSDPGVDSEHRSRVSTMVKEPVVVGRRVIMTSDVFADVEMFDCHDKHGKTVFESIDMTDSYGASLFLKTLISQPTYDIDILRTRTDILERTRTRLSMPPTKQPLALRSEAERQKTRKLEKDVIWLYRDRDEATSSLYDIAFFRTWFMRSLNSSPSALSAVNIYRIAVSPLIGVLSPILYFIIPYFVMRYKANDLRRIASDLGIPLNLPTNFVDYMRYVYDSYVAAEPAMDMMPSSLKWMKYASIGLSMMFYFQGLFNSFEISRTLRTVSRVINGKMTNVCKFFSRASAVINAYWSDDMSDAFFADLMSASELEDVMRGVHGEEESEGLDFGANVFNLGEGLSRYKLFDHARMMKLLRTYYATDVILSISRLSLSRSVPSPTCADFDWFSLVAQEACPCPERTRPIFDCRRLWHPCIPRSRVVHNDVIIDREEKENGGGAAHHPNVMMTGPNAGGKSTLIKSVVIAALLAQSIVVAPCGPGSRCSPFRFINSQINVPDVKGKRSLFEEEMFRARSNLEVVRGLLQDRPQGQTINDKQVDTNCALVVIDEIFSSTNPVEGVSGAYAVAKHLGMLRNCVTVISTHYPFLCRLARQTDLYSNYQMPVREDPTSPDGFVYPYRMERGLCKQYIALELLKKHGFDAEVIDEAISVKKELTAKSTHSSTKIEHTQVS